MRALGTILILLAMMLSVDAIADDDKVTRVFTWPTVLNGSAPIAACHWDPAEEKFSTSLSLEKRVEPNTVTYQMPSSALLGFGIVCQRGADGTLSIGILDRAAYLDGEGPGRVFAPNGELDAANLANVGILADGTVVQRNPVSVETPMCAAGRTADGVAVLLILVIELP